MTDESFEAAESSCTNFATDLLSYIILAIASLLPIQDVQ